MLAEAARYADATSPDGSPDRYTSRSCLQSSVVPRSAAPVRHEFTPREASVAAAGGEGLE